MISTPRNLTKRAAAGATAAIVALQLFAGATQAALPSASVEDQAAPSFYSAGNNPGLRTTFTYTDASTLSKLFAKVQIVDAASVANVFVTKNGVALPSTACAAETNPLIYDCTFKLIRPGDVVRVALEVVPNATGPQPSIVSAWGASGPGSGDVDNSHGDTWFDADHQLPVPNVTSFSTNPNKAGGFNKSSIETDQNVNNGNPVAARLEDLLAGLAADLDDNSSLPFPCVSDATVDCSKLDPNTIEANVGDGATFSKPFKLILTYDTGTAKAFVHIWTDSTGTHQETINPCAKKNPTSPCFLTSGKTYTLLMLHNGVNRKL